MIKLSQSAVTVVAADSRAAVADYDRNFISSLRLAANAAEGLQDSDIPAVQSQRLYQTFTESLGKQLESRKSLVNAIGQLQLIHKRSNQAETDAGCPIWYRDAAPAIVGVDMLPELEAQRAD
jgi:hypothetical protein